MAVRAFSAFSMGSLLQLLCIGIYDTLVSSEKELWGVLFSR